MLLTIIGTGKLASQLGRALQEAGHTIEAVYGRTEEKLTILSDKFSCLALTGKPDLTHLKSNLFILAISDDAIVEFVERLSIPLHAALVHTSGSVELSALAKFERIGVFYPLQTFSWNKTVDFKTIPLLVEANHLELQKMLVEVAETLSDKVLPVSSSKRLALHVSAVIACNFSNYLYSVSDYLLKKEALEFSLLSPLLKETLEKSLTIKPSEAQTGPAVRGDEKIINKHLDYLKNEPEIQELYQFITKQIQDGRL